MFFLSKVRVTSAHCFGLNPTCLRPLEVSLQQNIHQIVCKIHKCSHDFPLISLWFPYDFPMISPWFPYDFPMISRFWPSKRPTGPHLRSDLRSPEFWDAGPTEQAVQEAPIQGTGEDGEKAGAFCEWQFHPFMEKCRDKYIYVYICMYVYIYIHTCI
jgi:hypothetical protein